MKLCLDVGPGGLHLRPGFVERACVLDDHVGPREFFFLRGLHLNALAGGGLAHLALFDQPRHLHVGGRVHDPHNVGGVGQARLDQLDGLNDGGRLPNL